MATFNRLPIVFVSSMGTSVILGGGSSGSIFGAGFEAIGAEDVEEVVDVLDEVSFGSFCSFVSFGSLSSFDSLGSFGSLGSLEDFFGLALLIDFFDDLELVLFVSASSAWLFSGLNAGTSFMYSLFACLLFYWKFLYLIK